MKLLKNMTLALSVVFFATLVAAGEAYKIDNSHSKLGFTVTHLMVSKTAGEFLDYTGELHFDASNLDASKLNLKIKADSVDTRNEDRDKHLKSGDFFDTEKFPEITYESKKFLQAGKNIKIVGALTIKGKTKDVVLEGQASGPVNSPWGGTVVGLNLSGQLNRKDFDITWNKAMDGGGKVIGEIVKIVVVIEGHKK